MGRKNMLRNNYTKMNNESDSLILRHKITSYSLHVIKMNQSKSKAKYYQGDSYNNNNIKNIVISFICQINGDVNASKKRKYF